MKMNNLKTLFFIVPALFFTSCGGSDGTSISDLTDEKKDPCAEMEVSDFDGFLGLYEDTPESEFKNILPGEAYGDYTEDGSTFQYVFDDVQDVSTYVNVNAESGAVEFFTLLLNSYSADEVKATKKRMESEYDIEDCHNQFFLMSQKEIEKIMGTDNEVKEIESGDYWLEYNSGEDMAVHFYFPTDNTLGCIMIRVIYDW
jgi:hypothetical protein